MKKKQTFPTPVLEFLTLAWGNASKRGPLFSYERLNHTMQRALFIAVWSFEFQPDDWTDIVKRFSSGYWLETERYYTAAVGNGNLSAIVSIEKHLGRTPLIADEVRVASNWQDTNLHGSPGVREKERLHLGAEFTWKGHRVKVTSMGTDSCVACSYKVTREAENCDTCGHTKTWPKEKLHKRFIITRELIIEERAERKRRGEIWDRLCDLSAAEKVQAAIGSAKREDFDRTPLKKLERLLAKIEGEA